MQPKSVKGLNHPYCVHFRPENQDIFISSFISCFATGFSTPHLIHLGTFSLSLLIFTFCFLIFNNFYLSEWSNP